MSKPAKPEIKLFNRWSYEGIQIKDPTVINYINLKAVIVPFSCGRHEHRKFWKSSKVNIVERFINKLLSPGFMSNKIKGHKSSYNAGKKSKLIRSIKTAFIIIETTTGQNPIQVLVDAITTVAPREETTRLTMGGISYASAVDVSPQRRIDLAIKFLIQAVAGNAHDNIKTLDENIAQELTQAAKNSQDSKAIKRRDELERIAVSAR